jgi:hypothetical protein
LGDEGQAALAKAGKSVVFAEDADDRRAGTSLGDECGWYTGYAPTDAEARLL